MFSIIRPHTYVALRIPSGQLRVTKLIPDTTIALGKYGSFNSNLLIGRPYYLTYEILDLANPDDQFAQLRVVSAAEIHAEALSESEPTPAESRDETSGHAGDGVQYDIAGEDGELVMRNNRLTVDDSARQILTTDEIEKLKKAGTSKSGREIIAKIMQSHSALDEKTAFSLAKYTLRKAKKYLRRFTVLPLDVSLLAQWIVNEKDPARVLELREETIGLMTAWSNVHCGGISHSLSSLSGADAVPHHRWLVVDDSCGLVVAAMAEKMGILFPNAEEESGDLDNDLTQEKPEASEDEPLVEVNRNETGPNMEQTPNGNDHESSDLSKINSRARNTRRYPPDAMSATSNTITLIHPASQPNLSLLNYFSYDSNESGSPAGIISAMDHPLHTHLKTLSWLQLLSPHLDTACMEPPVVPSETLNTWKPGKRGAYYRKRRRWERAKRVVEETQAGGFDGLVVASATGADSILHHTVPLLRGGAQIVVYSPNVEPLGELMDAYSSGRKTAFMAAISENSDADPPPVPSSDFPVDPRLVLAPALQTVRAREWQVLPGRTHPLMTSRGGPEGYLFTATRVLPVEGKVEARGRFSKKRKTAGGEAGVEFGVGASLGDATKPAPETAEKDTIMGQTAE